MKRIARVMSFWGLTILNLQLTAIGGAAEQAANTKNKTPRLRLEVVRTLPDPVIGKETVGAESIPGGFE